MSWQSEIPITQLKVSGCDNNVRITFSEGFEVEGRFRRKELSKIVVLSPVRVGSCLGKADFLCYRVEETDDFLAEFVSYLSLSNYGKVTEVHK